MKCSRCHKEFESTTYKTCDACRQAAKQYRDAIPRQYKQGECSSTDGVSKKCSDCLTIKSLDAFYKHKRYKDGYRNQCIDCHSKRWKLYYDTGYNQVLKDKLQNDVIYKLKQNQRTYLIQQLKASSLKKKDSTSKYIGCSIEHLKQWLSYQNSDWGNMQLDHIIPVSLFDLHDETERKIAFNWTNIQPLPKKENLEKYNKLRGYEYFNSIINICRFITDYNIHNSGYQNVKNSLQWIKSKYTLRHFQIAGNSLGCKAPSAKSI